MTKHTLNSTLHLKQPISYLPFMLLKGNMMRLIDHHVVNHSKFVVAFFCISVSSLWTPPWTSSSITLQFLLLLSHPIHIPLLASFPVIFMPFLFSLFYDIAAINNRRKYNCVNSGKERWQTKDQNRANQSNFIPCVVNRLLSWTFFQLGTMSQLQMEIDCKVWLL